MGGSEGGNRRVDDCSVDDNRRANDQHEADESDAAVLKVDVDTFQAIAGEYEVQGIPTLLVFVDGELAERMVGAQTGNALSETIANYTA